MGGRLCIDYGEENRGEGEECYVHLDQYRS